MRTLLRYLLLTVSIAALTSTIATAKADELKAPVDTKPSDTQQFAVKTSEIIPKDFVMIKDETDSSIASLLLDVAKKWIPMTKVNKDHSLLNWTSYERETDFEVEPYERIHHFGKWVKDSKDKSDCHNTRAKVLMRDSVTPVVFSDENPCSVVKGEWQDPYAGRTLTDAVAEIQIDHMVPLKNAYISGAYSWDYKARCLYGNYLGLPFHLISVDGVENNNKSDKTPEQYMPPKKEYACTYLKNWLTVKALWGLEMTASEATAIKNLIKSENCSEKDFTISEKTIEEQRKFAFDHADLCFFGPPSASAKEAK